MGYVIFSNDDLFWLIRFRPPVPKKESFAHDKWPWLKEITLQQKKAKL